MRKALVAITTLVIMVGCGSQSTTGPDAQPEKAEAQVEAVETPTEAPETPNSAHDPVGYVESVVGCTATPVDEEGTWYECGEVLITDNAVWIGEDVDGNPIDNTERTGPEGLDIKYISIEGPESLIDELEAGLN